MKFHPVVELSKASIEKRDLEGFVRLWQTKKVKTVLEIGTWKGYSAEVWIELFRPDYFITLEKDNIYEDVLKIQKENYHYLFNTDSSSSESLEKVKNILQGRQVDFLFIDADHRYEAVKTDFEMYSPLVAEGGMIAFHDILYVHKLCQVKLFWDQLKLKYPYMESNIGSGSTGLGFIYYEHGEKTVAQKSIFI